MILYLPKPPQKIVSTYESTTWYTRLKLTTSQFFNTKDPKNIIIFQKYVYKDTQTSYTSIHQA